MEGMSPSGLSVHPSGEVIAFTAGELPHKEVWVIENLPDGL